SVPPEATLAPSPMMTLDSPVELHVAFRPSIVLPTPPRAWVPEPMAKLDGIVRMVALAFSEASTMLLLSRASKKPSDWPDLACSIKTGDELYGVSIFAPK